MQRRAKRYLEGLCWTAAVLCLLPYALSAGARAWYSSVITADAPATVAASDTLPAVRAMEPAPSPPSDIGETEYALWAPQRLRDLLRYQAEAKLPVAAVLRLPHQNRDIPVFAGISEASMTLGAGHLQDTSPLDGNGNIALSAHRDGSFRVLKDVNEGDPLVLSVGGKKRLFTVSRLFVVEPDDVEVLDATGQTTLTLITCYPIYYIGKAPQRYIVQAELVADTSAAQVALASGKDNHFGHYLSIEKQMRRNDL